MRDAADVSPSRGWIFSSRRRFPKAFFFVVFLSVETFVRSRRLRDPFLFSLRRGTTKGNNGTKASNIVDCTMIATRRVHHHHHSRGRPRSDDDDGVNDGQFLSDAMASICVDLLREVCARSTPGRTRRMERGWNQLRSPHRLDENNAGL